MVETFGEVLRSLREQRGIGLRELAQRTYMARSLLGYVETGERRPTARLAEACDRVLGSTPLLTVLAGIDGEDNDMRRRAFMLAGTAIGLSGIGGAEAVAEVLRASTEPVADWDAVVAEYSRRLVQDPSPEFGESLVGKLARAEQLATGKGRPEHLKAFAELSQIYGLYVGNLGDVAGARGWYRSAVAVADRSGHTGTRVYTRGRAASRGIYEGATVRETADAAGEALALSSLASAGALEAWSALVHVHGLTGNLGEGRKALAGMARVAESLPDEPAGAHQRYASFRNYLECRVGSWRDAERAFSEAEPALRPVPVWHADARVYYGRAIVTSGDVHGGISYTLDAVRTLTSDVRVVSMGVSDVIAATPAGYRSSDLEELRTYAAAGPGPWETLA